MIRARSTLLTILGLITVAVACKLEATPTPNHSSPERIQVQATVDETPMPFQLNPVAMPQTTQTEPSTPFSYGPIPIPVTPSSPANIYRLRNWTEGEWLASIDEAKIFITRLTENRASLDSVYTVQDLTKHLIMMEREALLRYPNMDDYKDVAWDLAYRESVVVERVALFVSLLEKGLNSGGFTLESLISQLSHRGFAVVETFESDDLFGPGHSGIVLRIETYDEFDESTIAIISVGGSSPGDFHVVPVKQSWEWNYRSYKTISVADLNENGVDDILLVNDHWGSGFPGWCASKLALYEWYGTYPDGQFENIAANVSDVGMSTSRGECERTWEFEDENVSGVPVIKATSRFYILAGQVDCPRYEEWTLYQWNGQTYEWMNEGANSIEGPPQCTIGWVNLAGGMNDEAVSLIKTALLDWPSAIDDIWGPTSEDYFRFKLGTWYALRGETELAVETLESVRDRPTNPDFAKPSELATLYLTYYVEQGANVACDAVQEHILETAPHPVCCGYDTDTMLETWGFANPHWGHYIIRDEICEQGPSTSPLANTAPPKTDSWTLAEQEQAIIQIEQALFKVGDFVQARTALLDLLDADLIGSYKGKVRSYLLYLLALTYELSGEENSAVNLYWQVWNEYPESPYVLTIRNKLEPIEGG